MQRLGRHLGTAVVLSELSHVFCCVLPTVVTVLGAFANIGLMGAAPGFLLEIHEVIHHYEMLIIAFSGMMIALGWAAHRLSRTVNCEDDGCCHPPCTPKKDRNFMILSVASVLFVFNLVIYLGVHQNIFDLAIFDVMDAHEGHHHTE
ncbi:MAG: hypothetical protein WC043_05250 [Pseudobdellovibrionaceae bacterium]